MQLGHAVEADGRWRIFAIAPAGDRGQAGGAMADLFEFLTSANDIYPVRGVDRQQGCLVVVRPDQYAAPVLPIAAYETMATFFGGFLSRV